MPVQRVSTDNLIGRQLGDFVVTERIGAGGFGVVYRAEQLSLKRDAVIKVLHHQIAGEGHIVERFLREAALAARLEHPFAAHIYAFGSEPDGLLWIGMEYVRGAPLDDLLRRSGPLSLDVLLPLFERICEVVASAHEQGIVHRDIKPANVMVMSRAGKRVPKLLDFGIATAFETKLERSAPAPEPADAPGTDSALTDTMPLESGEVSGRLTRVGATIGSPPYMAPEQWVDSSAVDQAADIYALGILAFEALHGRPPFVGTTVAELTRAHLETPPPPVSGDLPAELDAFFAAALAKKREDRPASAIALAELFASCAGIRDQPLALAAPIESVLSLFAGDGPQPIAELCGALVAARNPHEALNLIDELDGEIARYLGILALAARNHIGPAAGGDPPIVAERLRDLRNRGLDGPGWLQLAGALVATAESHPLPELLELLSRWPDTAADSGVHKTAVKGAEAVRQKLEHRLEGLADRLRELEFVCDYPIVLARDGYAERWMGQRGRTIPSAPLGALDELDTGVCHLANLAGRPVLDLDPLIVVREPSAGADAELFVLDGAGRRGGRYVSRPEGFEIEDGRIWEWLREVGLLGDTDRGLDGAVADEPYPGLVAFTRADAGRFFGRELETEGCLNRLRGSPVLCVVGPSGAGKSSFVQAGLLAALDGWRDIYLRPGKLPLDALADALTRAGADIDAAALRDAPRAAGSAVEALSGDAPTVVLIDQLEELFTLCQDNGEREAFAAAVAGLIAGGRVSVIMTLRDDFLIRAQSLSSWRGFLEPALKLLATPAPADLRRALAEPARQAGYTWESPELLDEIVEEVAGETNALALLAFAARQLWERRDRGFHRLSRRAYEDMGGVAGAVARHAESVIEDMAPGDRALVRKLFRHLVTAEGTRAVLRRDELLELSGDRERASSVLERLLASRLLHTSEGDDENAIELAHEALLSAWPRLAEWLRLDAEGARLRDELRAAAKQWDKRERPDGLLWRGDTLAELRAWVERHGTELTSAEIAFVDASNRLERQSRSRRRVALGAVIAVLVAGLVALYIMNERTAEQRAIAHRRLIASYVDQGRQALMAGDHARAASYLDEARRAGGETGVIRFLLDRALRPQSSHLTTFELDAGSVWAARYSPIADLVATAHDSGQLAFWRASDGARVAVLEVSEGPVLDVAFSPDGTRLATAAADGRIRVWDPATRAEIARARSLGALASSVRFARGGQTVAAAAVDGTVALWDLGAEGERKHAMSPGQAHVEVSPDGALIAALVTSSPDIAILDAATGAVRATISGPANASAAAFSFDGRLVAAADASGVVRVWAPGETEPRLELVGHDATVDHVSFSPDGRYIATAGRDRIARVWNAANGDKLSLLRHPSGIVWRARFSPDSTRVLTAGGGGDAILWEAATGRKLAIYEGHTSLISDVVFSRTGDRALTASWDSLVHQWSVGDQYRLDHRPAFARGCASGGAVGRWMAIACPDGSRVWDQRDGRLFELPAAAHIAPARTAARVATASGSDARVFELSSPSTPVELAHPAEVIAVAITGGGERVATLDAKQTLRLWRDGSVAWTRPAPPSARTLAFAPNGQLFCTGDFNAPASEILRFDPETGEPAPPIEVESPTAALRFSDDGDYLLALGERVEIWSLANGRRTGVLSGHVGYVSDARLSADRRRLVTTSLDTTARVWSFPGGELISVLSGSPQSLTSADFGPGDDIVATAGGDGFVRFWEPHTGQLLWEMATSPDPTELVRFGGDALITVGSRGRVSTWALASDPSRRSAVPCWSPWRFDRDSGRAVPREGDGC